MPIGYVTANQGESRYTVAIPRKTPLLESLIEARRTELDGIANALQALESQESNQRAAYDAAMFAVNAAIAGYNQCRESYTELQCRNAKTAEANDAYSAAMSACFDEWRDCLFACDIGDRDCQDACDDTREACETAAERVRDNALAAVNRLCADAVTAHLQACQETWAPIVAAAQATATDITNDLQNTLTAISWEKSKKLAATQRLNELLAIESSSESVTAWSAQYNTAIPTGEVPDEPTGSEDNAVIVAAVSGRAVITEIASVEPCLHDSRALPSGVLFVDSALAPGTETWRPTWRTGTVTAIYDPANPGDWPDPEKPLRVRIDPALMYGTLGTRVSRNPINCTPPGAFFDEDGELDARLGIARQAYDDALDDLADVRAEIQTCKDGYTVQDCTAPRNEVCEYNREQSMMACIDNRDYCLSIAQDANGEQYCLDQFNACEQQVDAIFSACVDGVLADCIEAKRAHDAQCEQASQFALSQAETAVSTAQRNLLNASADIQGPPFELILDVAVEHCFPDSYEIGDDVLIDFPERGTSTGLDWATATSEQIRAAAMKVWKSAQVVGWASETRECNIIYALTYIPQEKIGGVSYDFQPGEIIAYTPNLEKLGVVASGLSYFGLQDFVVYKKQLATLLVYNEIYEEEEYTYRKTISEIRWWHTMIYRYGLERNLTEDMFDNWEDVEPPQSMTGLGIYKNALVFQSLDEDKIWLEYFDLDTGVFLKREEFSGQEWTQQRIGGNNNHLVYGSATETNFQYNITPGGGEIDVFAMTRGSYHVDVDVYDRVLYCAETGMIASSIGASLGSMPHSGIVPNYGSGSGIGDRYESQGIVGSGLGAVVAGGTYALDHIGRIYETNTALTRYELEEGEWVVRTEVYLPNTRITCLRTDRASIVARLREDERILPPEPDPEP